MASASTHATGWLGRARRLRRTVVYALAVLLILLGALVGTASQVLPLAERYPDAVAAWLSDRAGRPVAFDRMQVEWTRRGPLLELEGLRIGAGDSPFRIDEAQLLVSIYSGLVPGKPLTELRMSGIDLALSRDDQGRWSVAGLDPGSDRDTDPLAALDALEGLGEIQVRDASLALSLDEGRRSWTIPRVDLRLRVSGRRIRLGLLGYSDVTAEPLVVVAELDRSRGDGRVHVRAEGTDLGRWAGEGDWFGLTPRSGRADLSLWLRLSGRRVVGVDADVHLVGVVLDADGQGLPDGFPADGPLPSGVPLLIESLRADGAWHSDGAGWALQVPRLSLRMDGVDHDYGELLGRGAGRRGAFSLQRLHLAPVGRLAALLAPVPEGLRQWLGEARPEGTLSALEVAIVDGRPGVGRARLDGLAFAATGQRPGIAGVGGELAFDADGAVLHLDDAVLAVDWRLAFGEVLSPRVTGELALWRGEEGWALGSPSLRIDGGDYGATARIELGFTPGGGRPRLSIAADVDASPISAAHRFWVRHLMPEASVEWLERALVDGRVDGAHAVLSGDLDDWPFADGEGVFESEARLSGVELAFSPEWPNAVDLSGTAAFTGTGMRVETRGVIAGVEVSSAAGHIRDWSDAVLGLEASGSGDGRQLLQLLRSSPLQAGYGEQLDTLEVDGPARVGLSLQLPLGADRATGHSVRGTVDLGGVRLADPRWDLEFSRATGRLRFSETGFSAEELSVRHEDRVASLSIAVGDHTSGPERWVEASLRGRFGFESLLARAEMLDWLSDSVRGEADVTISLRVPVAEDGTAATPMLSVRSDLVGVDLDLPAPLRKRPSVSLPLRVDVALPVEDAEIQLRLGGLAHLRGRITGDSGLVGMLALGQPAEPSSGAESFSVVGQAAVLDAAGWASIIAGGVAGGTGATRLGEFDVFAGQLDLLDRAFIETRLRLLPGEDGHELHMDGPEILGSVDVPNDIERGLVGRFERLYWPAGRQASGGMSVDPSGVPALDFVVDDLRFGDAVLGRARLLTYPTPEGMQVERLQAESADMGFNAVGTWSQIDDRAYSRFSLKFSSGNLGRMLESLGYAGIVEGGVTEAELVAGWVGSPAAFGLDAVEGRLDVQVGPGRILDVEPGAGRLLGLVSLAELPRRLTLDFSDFFGQGFGFNEIRGSFILGGGQARTDDLRIDGPAAEIRVRGSTALQAQTYDQTIEVLPKTGGVLPLVGAITGGPAGAAIGAVAQAILNQPFKEAARTVYRVTGAWSSPEVEVIERGPAPRTGEPRATRERAPRAG